MQDAFLLSKGFGEVLYQTGAPFHHDHLGAKMVVEVDVGRGEDGVVVLVLELRELVAEAARVVIVDKRDRADSLGVLLPLQFDKARANQVADEFGAVLEMAPLHEAGHLLHEVCFNAEAQSSQVGHARSS